MKRRRLILTLECVTTYTLAEIRAALTHVALSHGRWITRYPDNEDDGMPNRIVQVQANAIKPEPKRFRSAKEAMDHYAPKPSDLIDATQNGPHPAVSGGKRIRSMKATHIPRGKAKRAKGDK